MPEKKQIKTTIKSSADLHAGKRTFIAEHTMYPKSMGANSLKEKETKFIVDWQITNGQ